MKSYEVLCSVLVSTLAAASPTVGGTIFSERCTLDCTVGNSIYLKPTTGECTCVKEQGCTKLCSLNLAYYTNPATGVCSCVPECNTATADDCDAGYNCVPNPKDCKSTTAANNCPGVCIPIKTCAMDCLEGMVHYTDPATGLCSCVRTCGAASDTPCPTGFACTPTDPSVNCDVLGACTYVCLAKSCLTC
jgi:hypothetical protein